MTTGYWLSIISWIVLKDFASISKTVFTEIFNIKTEIKKMKYLLLMAFSVADEVTRIKGNTTFAKKNNWKQ